MRTSSSQFQLLVEFMERNGDLSKPTEGPQGRASNIQRWGELAELLNADATGDTKTVEKWRKVWSDYKNNSKKKASRIYKATRGTGGGPASNMKLNDLEERALSIIGTQAATGIIEIPEVGLEDEVIEPPSECPNNSQIHEQETFSFAEDWNRPGTSRQPPLIHPPMHVASTSEIELGLVGSGAPEAGGPATDPRVPLETALHIASSAPPAASTEAPSTLPPTSARRRIHSPTPLPLTPRRRRRGQDPSSPIRRRTRTQTQSELARQAFVRSDCEWRAFHQDAERERNRLRENEIANQQRWLDIFEQMLALGNRFADIFEKK